MGLLLLALGWVLASLDPGRTPASALIERIDTPHESVTGTKSTLSTPSGEEPAPAPQFRPEQIEGRWVRKGTIQRDITILPDGKARLTVQLDYLSALIYGREMNMDLTWDLKGDILTHTIINGSPKANVDRLIRDFGASLSYRVVKADQTELVLEDLDEDMEQHHWKAAKPTSPSTVSARKD